MNKQVLETVLQLKDKLTPALQKTSQKGKQSLDKLTRSSKNLEKGMGATALSWVKFAAAVAAATIAIRGAIKFMGEAIKLAGIQETAVVTLNAALKAQGNFTEAASISLQNYATSLQGLLGIGDEVTLETMAMIEGLTGLSTKALPDAMRAIIQISTLYKVDYKASAILLGKSLTSSLNAFSRYGIEIDMTGTAIERLTEILEGTKAGWGIALDAVKTHVGVMTILEAAYGDILEAIGGFITKSPEVRGAIRDLTTNIIAWTKELVENEDIQRLVNKQVRALIDLAPKLISAMEKMTKAVDDFGKPFVVVVAAIVGTRGLYLAITKLLILLEKMGIAIASAGSAVLAFAAIIKNAIPGATVFVTALALAWDIYTLAQDRARRATELFNAIQPLREIATAEQIELTEAQRTFIISGGRRGAPGPGPPQVAPEVPPPFIPTPGLGGAGGPVAAAIVDEAQARRDASAEWGAHLKRERDIWIENMANWNRAQEEAVQRARDIALMLHDVIEQARVIQRRRDIAGMIERRGFPSELAFDPTGSEGLMFRIFGGRAPKKKKGDPRFSPELLESIAAAGIGGFAAGGLRGGLTAALPLIGSAFGPIGSAVGGALASIFGKKKRGAVRSNPVFVEEVKKGDMALALLNIFKGQGAAAGGRTINDINNLIRGGGATLGFSSAPQ